MSEFPWKLSRVPVEVEAALKKYAEVDDNDNCDEEEMAFRWMKLVLAAMKAGNDCVFDKDELQEWFEAHGRSKWIAFSYTADFFILASVMDRCFEELGVKL